MDNSIRVIGRTLFQWDLNRKVTVPDEINLVHFWPASGGKKICSPTVKARTVHTYQEEGRNVADIPNDLLMKGNDLICMTYADGRTIDGTYLTVGARPCPSDYIYEPTEVITFETLQQWVVDQLQIVTDDLWTKSELTPIPDESIEAIFIKE